MESLRKKMLKKLQIEQKDLIKSKPVTRAIIGFLSAKENWLYVLLLSLLLMVFLSLPGPGFLQFIILKEDTVKLIIESRITTIVTIISMTLAVTGLLLSNLAIKHNLTYELMFKRSGLYLIIYFALSTIAFLITISTLRNTLGPELFGRLVLAGGYMCLFVIFGIGLLFRSIIEFTTPDSIEGHLKKALLEEYKANICFDLLKSYSFEEFRSIMKDANIEEISLMHVLFADPKNKDDEMFVHDIRLDLLRKVIKGIKQPGKITYIPIGININTRHHQSYLSIKEKSTLSSCLILQPSKGTNGKETQYFKYFADKLDEYSKDGKHERASEILDMFLDMYRIEYSKTSA
jgi:hypothetical protein